MYKIWFHVVHKRPSVCLIILKIILIKFYDFRYLMAIQGCATQNRVSIYFQGPPTLLLVRVHKSVGHCFFLNHIFLSPIQINFLYNCLIIKIVLSHPYLFFFTVRFGLDLVWVIVRLGAL